MADLFIVGVAPIDYSPILLLRLFGFRIAPDTLSSAGLSKASATAPIASGWSVSPVGACTHLYEGLACQDVFSRSTFLLFVSFKGSSREHSSALMAWRPLCLAALSGQSPEPGGSRRKARGLTAKARAERQWCLAITLQPFCVPGDPLPPLKIPITIVQLIQGGARSLCDTRRINLYPVGANPYQGPSCNSARAQGSKGGWDPSGKRAYCSHVGARSHIQPWNQ